MKIETREIYKCDHCRKIYQIKRYCIAHEPSCSKNPLNYMACIDCSNAVKKDMKHIAWIPCLFHGETEENRVTSAFWCKAKKHWIYPHICTNPIPQEDIEGEIKNEPMPNKCDYFKEIK